MDFGFGWDEAGQYTGEPLGLGGEVEADPAVARGGGGCLGEDQVDDVQDRAQAGAALVGRGNRERNPRRGKSFLRASDAGLHGRGGDQERLGDLITGQTTDHAQCQGDLGPAGQHRVAGHEHERKDVVVDLIGIPEWFGAGHFRRRSAGGRPALAQFAGEGGVPVVAGGPAAEGVDGPPPAHGEQPTGRIARDTRARPGHQRLGQRLLREVLGQGEIAGVAGERTHDPRGFDAPDRGHDVTTGGVGHVSAAHSCPVASRHARSR